MWYLCQQHGIALCHGFRRAFCTLIVLVKPSRFGAACSSGTAPAGRALACIDRQALGQARPPSRDSRLREAAIEASIEPSPREPGGASWLLPDSSRPW